MHEAISTSQAPAAVDLVLRNGRLPGGGQADLAIDGGRFVAVGENLAQTGGREVDLAGRLVLPGLVDVHHHIDKAYTFSRLGGGHGLLDAIRRVEREPMTAEDVYQRGRALVERLIRHGVCAMRTHVDINRATGLRSVEAVLALRREYAGRLQIQVVAFPQGDADLDHPTDAGLVRQALEMGCSVVGGVPSLSPNPRRYVDAILGLAREFDCLVDLHVDEAEVPSAEVLEYLAGATIRAGLTGRVTAGHCCTLAVVADAVADRVIARVREAGVSIVTCPMTNLYLMGGEGRVPGFRGLTRVRDLLQAGVNVCCGSDNVQDPFNPYGNGDPVLAALIGGLAARLGAPAEQEQLLASITTAGAQAMHLEGYGLAPGCRADLVAVPAASAGQVLAEVPADRMVVLGGQLLQK